MNTPMVCPTCSNNHVVKKGFKTLASGRVQRFTCANNHVFTGQERFHHASQETKTLAVEMAREGLGQRAIARTLKVHLHAVQLWLEKKVQPPQPLTRRIASTSNKPFITRTH